MEIGIDLTKIKIKKYIEFSILPIMEESISGDIVKAKDASNNIGIDLIKDVKYNKIDLTKYGKDIR